MLNGEEALTITPACTHANAKSKITTTPKGRNLQSQIQFVCPDCGQVARIFGSSGFVETGTILWTWDSDQVRAARTKSDVTAGPKKDRPQADPAKGLPGTEMLRLTDELGIKSPPTCGCKTTAAQMDSLGLAECRARAATLELAIASNYDKWGWKDKLKAVTAAAWNGAGLGINPREPVKDLLEIAFDRAEKQLVKENG